MKTEANQTLCHDLCGFYVEWIIIHFAKKTKNTLVRIAFIQSTNI